MLKINPTQKSLKIINISICYKILLLSYINKKKRNQSEIFTNKAVFVIKFYTSYSL